MRLSKIIEEINIKKSNINENCNVVLISDINLQPHFELMLKYYFLKDRKNVIFNNISYYECNDKQNIDKIRLSDLVIIWLNFENLYQDVPISIMENINLRNNYINKISENIGGFYNNIISLANGKVIIIGFEDFFDKDRKLYGHIISKKNIVLDVESIIFKDLELECTILDLKGIIASIGISNAFNDSSKYKWNNPYSNELIEAVIKEIGKNYNINPLDLIKCIVLDCDNVLWKGILSEDGIDNIILSNIGIGKKYKDFQKFILSLYYRGLILAVCSKNDYCDIMNIFKSHEEMILKDDKISIFQVNWKNKAENITNISKLLNLSLENILFIDDSAFEIESVKFLIPEVKTILFNINTIYDELAKMKFPSNFNNNEIIRLRNKTYKNNQKRLELLNSLDNYNDYLEKLNSSITFKLADIKELSRISDLSFRTNKCTNLRRYQIGDIKKNIKSENYIYISVYVKDCFGDLGLVGAMGIYSDVIDLFCLSCRALGRGVEEKMLNYIINKYNVKSAYFYTNNKNNDLKKLFLKNNIDISTYY